MKCLRPQAPTGLISGQKASLFLSKLMSAYSQITDFDQLPTPFRCVAVDVITGKEVVLKSGSLAKALRSSMSIPSLFAPVEWDDYLLVDGALANNIPVEVVREMGADIVIVVNVGSPMENREGLRTMLGVLKQAVLLPALQRDILKLQKADLEVR